MQIVIEYKLSTYYAILVTKQDISRTFIRIMKYEFDLHQKRSLICSILNDNFALSSSYLGLA